MFKAVVRLFIWSKTYLNKAPKHLQPTYLKSYAECPGITNRVFVPSDYKSGSAALPLFIDIHGGGFAIGAPLLDDPDNIELSQKHGICVVSIGYRLAPKYPFPIPVQDCAAAIQAVLADPDLPADKSKVAVGGYSAGGNLALAATQLNGLNKRIKGAVAYYPSTNWTESREEKLEKATSPPGKKDMLVDMIPMLNLGYIDYNQDRRDPLLSPHFAERAALPEKLYILGCEYDLLCSEAEETAEKNAELETGQKVADIEGVGWTKGRVRWRKILGVEHGFNNVVNSMKEAPERKRLLEKRADMHADVARWLKAEVYA